MFCFCRTQDLHRGSGQRRQDDDLVPVPDERGRPDLAHHRLQRRGGHVEERPVHHVGPRGTGLAQGSLEHILLKHRGRTQCKQVCIEWI